MEYSKKFTTYIEENTPRFKKIYTGLAQPLKDNLENSKENIFHLINSENGEIEKTFFGKKHKKIYKEIKKYKKRGNIESIIKRNHKIIIGRKGLNSVIPGRNSITRVIKK